MRKIFGNTDPGLLRAANQDGFACEVLADNMLFGVLCDGMGGENGGGVASELAVKLAANMLRQDLRADMSEVSLRLVLSSVIAGANAVIYEQAQKDTELAGMGTTMILAVLLNHTLYIAYVGDSRVYVVSPTENRQLTRDHTIVQMLVDMGEITEEDAKTHPKRHFITRAVGVSSSVEPDFLVEVLAEDDVVLLCSDGLYNYMDAGVTYPLLQDCGTAESAQPLITLANNNGGSDNITALLIV